MAEYHGNLACDHIHQPCYKVSHRAEFCEDILLIIDWLYHGFSRSLFGINALSVLKKAVVFIFGRPFPPDLIDAGGRPIPAKPVQVSVLLPRQPLNDTANQQIRGTGPQDLTSKPL